MALPRVFARSSPLLLALLALPLAGLGLASLGCNNAPSQATPSASSSGAPIAKLPPPPPPGASAMRDARMHGRDQGGPVGAMFRAARDLQLTDAEKSALDNLEAQQAGDDTPRDDFKDLQVDTIAGIHAGKLDAAKLQSDFAAIDKAMAARQAKDAVALNGLYATLDATQRKALVAALRTREAARDAAYAAHAEVDAGSAADWTKRRLDRMTMQLGLDAGQQKAVGAFLAKGGDSMNPAAMRGLRDEGKKRMDAVLSAFEGDGFDAKKLDLAGVPGKTPHEGLEKDTTFLSQILPILTPDQREKLAAQREHGGMRHHPEGEQGRGAGGPGRDPSGGGGTE